LNKTTFTAPVTTPQIVAIPSSKTKETPTIETQTQTQTQTQVENTFSKQTTVTTPTVIITSTKEEEKISSSLSAVVRERPICGECGNPITSGGVIEAMNKEFHENCFVCVNCKSTLGGKFAVLEDKPHCPTCAVQLKKSGSRIGGGGSRIGAS